MLRPPFRTSRISGTASLISRGFTLIELLVAITIIGLLSGISFYTVAEAKVKATNARVVSQVRAFTNIIEAHKIATGEYPLTSGTVCLGGTDCGADSSETLNAQLEKSGAANVNPMDKKVAFNTDGDKRFRAWYVRCSGVGGYCEGDDIAEIVWYLEGSTADCGSGARKFISDSEGNTACVYKLSGTGTAINQAALGYDTSSPENTCTDTGACNHGAAAQCDYSCIVQCTDTGACNYGASESCDYSCLCNEPSACNYSGSSNGSYEVCDFSCHTTCTDTSACNYGSQGSCSYNCCTDSSACNHLQLGQTTCDYSCRGTSCNDTTACNYGAYGVCDYSSCQTYCGDYSACNYGAPATCEYSSCTIITSCQDTAACNYGATGSCDYSCKCSYDGSACNYNWNGTGMCDYSCRTSYCGDNSACNYGASANCEYTSCISDLCDDPNSCNYGSQSGCEYSCKCNTDSNACNYSWNGSGSCDYSCRTTYCEETGACNYGAAGSCDYSCF